MILTCIGPRLQVYVICPFQQQKLQHHLDKIIKGKT